MNGSTDPRAIVNARNLYQSCLNESAIEIDGVGAILSILNDEFGGWPIINGDLETPALFDFSDLLLKIRKYDNSIVYRVNTATNQVNSSVYDIEVRRRKERTRKSKRRVLVGTRLSRITRSGILQRHHRSSCCLQAIHQ
jgi:hypothetical protein